MRKIRGFKLGKRLCLVTRWFFLRKSTTPKRIPPALPAFISAMQVQVASREATYLRELWAICGCCICSSISCNCSTGWHKKLTSKVLFDERVILAHQSGLEASQPALTQYRVLGPTMNECSWIELQPLTSRKHQDADQLLESERKFH